MNSDDIAKTMSGEQEDNVITFKAGEYYSVEDIYSMLGVATLPMALTMNIQEIASEATNGGCDVVYNHTKRRYHKVPISGEQTITNKEEKEMSGIDDMYKNKEDKTMETGDRKLAFVTDEGKGEKPITAGRLIEGQELVEKFRGQEIRIINMDHYIKKGNKKEDGQYVAIQLDVMGDDGEYRWVTAPYRCQDNIIKFIDDNKYVKDGKYAGSRFVQLFKDEEYVLVVADKDAKLAKDGVHYNAQYDIYKK